VFDGFRATNKDLWLWVPAFAGTTHRVARVRTQRMATDLISNSQDAPGFNTVIARVAKQSIVQCASSGLLRRFAPRNDVAPNTNTNSHSRDAMRPGRERTLRPSEGVGNAGCPPHPQPRVRKDKTHELVTTVAPESPGIPAREWF
jgi:hypothetical protein